MGFEPRSCAPQADEMTTAPRRRDQFLLFYNKKYSIILTKSGLAHIFGDFFKNSSGRPDRDPGPESIFCYNNWASEWTSLLSLCLPTFVQMWTISEKSFTYSAHEHTRVDRIPSPVPKTKLCSGTCKAQSNLANTYVQDVKNVLKKMNDPDKVRLRSNLELLLRPVLKQFNWGLALSSS
jgi:hypothetical protein